MELVAAAASHSRDLSSYFDSGLQSDSLNVYHSSHAAMTDVPSSGISSGTEVNYPPLESSPSVITLLNDKLDAQSKVNFCFIFYLRRLLNNFIFSSYYLRQVNGVNGGDTVFVRCMCLCVCLCAVALYANNSKTVKATDFKFDKHVPTDSLDMTLENFS